MHQLSIKFSRFAQLNLSVTLTLDWETTTTAATQTVRQNRGVTTATLPLPVGNIVTFLGVLLQVMLGVTGPGFIAVRSLFSTREFKNFNE